MSGRAPSAIAMRRIQSELNDWHVHPPEGCELIQFEPLLVWVIRMSGPESASGMSQIYAGENFRVQVKFTDHYPLEPPEVTFVPPSPVHPHIYSNGHVCLDILYDGRNGGWSPALTINKLCLSLRSMLASNTDKRRPAGDLAYCNRTRGRSPKDTRWDFDDDTV